ncbi:MAG: hypothetical protein JO100_07115 [Pseudonocardia sp.]|nr:hypothetical protein [Pseudonocardia sp.]
MVTAPRCANPSGHKGGSGERARVAGAAARVLGGASGAAALLGSPVPMIVLGSLGLGALLIVGVVVLTPVLAHDDQQSARALTVLRMLLIAVFPKSIATQQPTRNRRG